MARYFFDVTDGGESHDDEGLEFLNAQKASREALHSLPDMAKSISPDWINEEIVVTMRDEHGHTLYRATLTIKEEWLHNAA